MARIEERASFDAIRYANCWEDAEVLVEALAPAEGQRVLSIASAGDNAFSLLSCAPEVVVAADLSGAQIAAVELRVAAFRSLEYEEMLGFLGFRPASSRAAVYRALRLELSSAARAFWDARGEGIEQGVIHIGKFEHYFSIFRRFILPLVHRRRTVRVLLEERTLEEQERFYDEQWDTLPWRWMFRIFFSRTLMGRLGRDPEFFRYVEGTVAERILSRTRYALTALPVHSNPYVRYILTGSFQGALPHYARRQVYGAIRSNLGALRLIHGSVNEAARHSDLRFDAFNLSDIFEYMAPEEARACGADLAEHARTGARFAYWNMLAPRRLSALLPGTFHRDDELADRLFKRDRAFFYSAFHLDRLGTGNGVAGESRA